MRFALQREMAGLGVEMGMVEVLNGPINDDDCKRVVIIVLKAFCESVKMYACEYAT